MINGVRVFACTRPTGGAGTEKYAYKLRWYVELARWLREQKIANLAVLGDMNVRLKIAMCTIRSVGSGRSTSRSPSGPRSAPSSMSASPMHFALPQPEKYHVVETTG